MSTFDAIDAFHTAVLIFDTAESPTDRVASAVLVAHTLRDIGYVCGADTEAEAFAWLRSRG